MSEFQLPVILVFILSLSLSLLFNKISLKFKDSKFEKKNKNQVRLSNLKIPTYGGISMSLAFFIAIRLLGKADNEIVQISIYAVFITLIGFIDDRYNLNWKLKLFLQFFAVGTPIYLLQVYLNIESLIGVNWNNNLNLLVLLVYI